MSSPLPAVELNIKAMCRLLQDSGDMTPTASRQIQAVMKAHRPGRNGNPEQTSPDVPIGDVS